MKKSSIEKNLINYNYFKDSKINLNLVKPPKFVVISANSKNILNNTNSKVSNNPNEEPANKECNIKTLYNKCHGKEFARLLNNADECKKKLNDILRRTDTYMSDDNIKANCFDISKIKQNYEKNKILIEQIPKPTDKFEQKLNKKGKSSSMGDIECINSKFAIKIKKQNQLPDSLISLKKAASKSKSISIDELFQSKIKNFEDKKFQNVKQYKFIPAMLNPNSKENSVIYDEDKLHQKINKD